MIQSGLRNRGYNEMITSMEFLIPQLFQWAGDANPPTARWAQHILIHVGKDLPLNAQQIRELAAKEYIL